MGKSSKKSSSIKRKANSQPSRKKKVKKNSVTNEESQQVATSVAYENFFNNLNDEKLLEAVFSHESTDKRLEIAQVINHDILDSFSKQTIYTQHQIRSYWKQILLFIQKSRCALTETPIVNDGSLINQLNDDCLAQIFMYLSPEERLRMEGVCKKWKRALQQAWSDIKELDYDHRHKYGLEYCIDHDVKDEEIARVLHSKLKVIRHSSRHLKKLNISCFPNTSVMPAIRLSCLNLVKLELRFTMEEKPDDLIDVFQFMPDLKSLEVTWTIRIPESFIKSLNRITDTLEDLKLVHERNIFNLYQHDKEENNFPVSWISTFRQFESLRTLFLAGYNWNDEMIQAIGQMNSLVKLQLYEIRYYDELLDIHPISNLKNLEHLVMAHFPISNNFLINLAKNSENLKYLEINSLGVSDAGIIPLTELEKLEVFKMLLDEDDNADDITDKSIGKFKCLRKLEIPYCNNVTNCSVIQILKNCPDIEELNLRSTGVTDGVVKEAARLTKNRKNNVVLNLTVSLEEIPEDLPDDSEYSSPWLKVINLDDDY